jgi:Flp pilus assembly protein TadG
MEFALILPILLLILGGIVDFARAFFELQTMVNAASEGARMAIVPSVPSSEVETHVNQFFADSDSAVSLGCTGACDCAGATGCAGDVVTVTVTRPFEQLFLGIFELPSFGISALPDSLTYTATGLHQ